jgi:glycerol-3-phosphate dehydrogenase
VVINATGAWAGKPCAARAPRLRPLRGSHLVLPAWRLPLAQAVSLMHPHDGRPVFAYPWEGATLVGTTDLDHERAWSSEAAHHARRTRLPDGGAAPGQFPHLRC